MAIDLYVIAETRSLPEELKTATVFILLEHLKSTCAAARGIPFADGDFRKPSGKPWKLKGLLSEMFKDVGMSQPDLQTVVRLRNEIVHAGVSRMPRGEERDIYVECQDLAREYFLRLFGYTGEFRLYSGRGMRTKRIRSCSLCGHFAKGTKIDGERIFVLCEFIRNSSRCALLLWLVKRIAEGEK